jgi:ATP-binding cassette subfamily F protein 3
VYKPIRLLSGGERARVRLAQLLLDKPNVLVLDEPTNHLDIASCEGLEAALGAFEGTVFCVSHDRYFLDHVTSRLLVLHPPDMTDFDGTYSQWIAKQKEPAEVERPARAGGQQRNKPKASAPKPSAPNAQTAPQRKEPARKKDNPYSRPYGRLTLKELEQQITDTEVAVAECQGNLGAAVKDAGRRQEMQAEYKRLSQKLDALEAEYYAREN